MAGDGVVRAVAVRVSTPRGTPWEVRSVVPAHRPGGRRDQSHGAVSVPARVRRAAAIAVGGTEGRRGPGDLPDLRRRTESRGHASVAGRARPRGRVGDVLRDPRVRHRRDRAAGLARRRRGARGGVALGHPGADAEGAGRPGRAARRAGRSDRGAERRPAVPAVPPPRRLARQRDVRRASIGPAIAWPGGDSRCGTSTGGGRRNPTAWPRGSPSAPPTARSW